MGMGVDRPVSPHAWRKLGANFYQSDNLVIHLINLGQSPTSSRLVLVCIPSFPNVCSTSSPPSSDMKFPAPFIFMPCSVQYTTASHHCCPVLSISVSVLAYCPHNRHVLLTKSFAIVPFSCSTSAITKVFSLTPFLGANGVLVH